MDFLTQWILCSIASKSIKGIAEYICLMFSLSSDSYV